MIVAQIGIVLAASFLKIIAHASFDMINTIVLVLKDALYLSKTDFSSL